MLINMDDLRQRLRDKGYKLTSQREIVLRAFMKHNNEHLSAEDVYQLVKKQATDIGIATIYRTLELLSELEVLQKMGFGDGRSRYEISKNNSAHQHHHLICLSCGKVKEFDDDLLETLETVIARESNFIIMNHQVKFYGYCNECQNKKQN